MIYLDTSAIIKLYVKEAFSLDISKWLRNNNEALPLTSFHYLEFMNAVKLKEFRKEISSDEAEIIISKFDTHEAKGIYYRPPLDWASMFKFAHDLSKKHTANMGSRSLDIMHVASALSLKADTFLTFDDKQSRLASLAGLRIKKFTE
ncbi:MAG: type II toxin-antitoxin system VapC family toxin [Deltaproteobacteria bacterium]|nr:type II toxin-antitoxin system VapC family toxin [Deltaproteobacteria bacterium]